MVPASVKLQVVFRCTLQIVGDRFINKIWILIFLLLKYFLYIDPFPIQHPKEIALKLILVVPTVRKIIQNITKNIVDPSTKFENAFDFRIQLTFSIKLEISDSAGWIIIIGVKSIMKTTRMQKWIRW